MQQAKTLLRLTGGGVRVCRAECSDDMDAFLQDVTYFQGQYDEDESYSKLSEALDEKVRCLGG